MCGQIERLRLSEAATAEKRLADEGKALFAATSETPNEHTRENKAVIKSRVMFAFE